MFCTATNLKVSNWLALEKEKIPKKKSRPNHLVIYSKMVDRN